MIVRYGARCWPETGGITIFECFARALYCFFFCKRFHEKYELVEETTEKSSRPCLRCLKNRKNANGADLEA